MLGTQDKQNT